MFCNVTATFPHDRETSLKIRNCRNSSASHSATSDRFWRLYRNLSYMPLRECMRIHAELPRWQSFAHLLINDTERFPKLAKKYRQALCNVDRRQFKSRTVDRMESIINVLEFFVLHQLRKTTHNKLLFNYVPYMFYF